jgi:uncharacterized protein (DUF4415 family)
MSNDNTNPTSRTDWERLRTMMDESIDYSDIAPLDEAFFRRAQLVLPNVVRLDPDVLAWFKQHDQDYTNRINDVLRKHIEDQKHAA